MAVGFVLCYCLDDLISYKTCFIPLVYIESLVLLEEIFMIKKKNEEKKKNLQRMLLSKDGVMLI